MSCIDKHKCYLVIVSYLPTGVGMSKDNTKTNFKTNLDFPSNGTRRISERI